MLNCNCCNYRIEFGDELLRCKNCFHMQRIPNGNSKPINYSVENKHNKDNKHNKRILILGNRDFDVYNIIDTCDFTLVNIPPPHNPRDTHYYKEQICLLNKRYKFFDIIIIHQLLDKLDYPRDILNLCKILTIETTKIILSTPQPLLQSQVRTQVRSQVQLQTVHFFNTNSLYHLSNVVGYRIIDVWNFGEYNVYKLEYNFDDDKSIPHCIIPKLLNEMEIGCYL